MRECLKIESPYITKNIHQKTLSLIKYLIESINEDKLIDTEDPLALALYVGKLQAAITEGEDIKNEIKAIIEEYEIKTFSESNLDSIF